MSTLMMKHKEKQFLSWMQKIVNKSSDKILLLIVSKPIFVNLKIIQNEIL